MKSITIRPQQAAYMDWELGVFFHFGIRTFNEGHRDWDMRQMKLESFAPSALDCRQWIAAAHQAGARYAVLVCKHHDGFANWPSRYTAYSVANTPWKGGQGDVVREYVDACRAFGVKVGLYYSPAEFGSIGKKGKAYDDYFINQVSELLTNYGRIDYLWFDGNGSADHEYDAERIVRAIRGMQPDILLFNMWDPDTRWVGNEAGPAHLVSPNVVNADSPTAYTDAMREPARRRFLPVECDIRMRRRNWFYSGLDADTVKSVEELMGIYDYSVGRGANLLINIGPDRRGLLPQADADRLIEFGEAVRRRFSSPLEGDVTEEAGAYTLTLGKPALVQTVVLREALATEAYVERFRIDCYPDGFGDPVAVYLGGTIGHKAICRFSPLYVQKIRVAAEVGALCLEAFQAFGV